MSTAVDLSALRSRLHHTRRELDRRAGAAHTLAQTGIAVAAEIDTLRGQINLHERAAALLTSISEQRQVTLQKQIEDLVTEGLHVVFGPDLSFHLVTGIRNRTQVIDFVVRSTIGDTVVDTEVMEARGGGLAVVVGFLLRLVVLLLATPAGGMVTMWLDETFTHVSAEYEPRLAEFVRQLVDRLDVQVVLVTHSHAYDRVADARYRLEQHDGVTTGRTV